MPQTQEMLTTSSNIQESASDTLAQKVEISVVVPMMNEEQNIRL